MSGDDDYDFDRPESDADEGDSDDRRRDEAPPRRARSRAGRDAGRRGGLFGREEEQRRPSESRRGRLDWGAAEGEGDEYEDEDSPPRRPPSRDDRYDYDDEERRPPRREPRAARQSLMDLCTPVFAGAALLPRDAGGVQPAYEQLRQQTLTALQRVETEASGNGIAQEDAREASYALSLFFDEQVLESEWIGKAQWAAETVNKDPEGGVNFFERAHALGDRQNEVRAVYLVCLALGFRGYIAGLPPEEQTRRLAEEMQRLLRTIHPEPLDRMKRLFPEAYRQATPIDESNVGQPPPRWWWIASLGTVAAAVLIWILMLWWAGTISAGPAQSIKKLLSAAARVEQPLVLRVQHGPGVGGEARPC